jgi:hypothetical protein
MEHHSSLDAKNLLEFIDTEASHPGPKISIFFSVPNASDFAMFGKADMRSLIQRAARRMTFSGALVESRLELEAALNDLVETPSLWENRVDGYAIFASNTAVHCYDLPSEVHRVVVVSDEFYIRPLIKMLAMPHTFYILQVSLGNVRLVRVMPQLVSEVPLGALPNDRASHDSDTTPVHDRNFHSALVTHGKSGASAMVPHGSHEDAKHAQGKRYLQHAAHLLDQLLNGKHVPVILIGPDSARGHFMHHAKYKNIISSSQELHLPDLPNHTARDSSHLWQECAKIVEGCQAGSNAENAISEFQALEGLGRTSHNAHDIRQLAVIGKIDTLLLGDSRTIDGVLSQEQYDENEAIINTLRHGGKVVEGDITHFDYPTAAILRAGAYAEMLEHDMAISS